MPNQLSTALVLAAALGLGACTTLTVEERTAACRATDWASYGRNDGLLGVPATDRVERFADCAELGYPADVDAYQAARAEGLEEYCTLENGYEVGNSGRRYRRVCPPELEVTFLQGYEQGRRDRPVYVYPAFGFGFGFGHFHHDHFGFHHGFFGHHRFHRRRVRWSRDHE